MYRAISEKSVILLEDISLSPADIEPFVRAAATVAVISLFPLDVAEDKVVGKRSEESALGGPERPVEESDVCETEAGTEADVEDENVDIVGGGAYVGVSGYESEGFTLFAGRDFQREVCPRASFTPLILHNVGF